MLFSIFAENEWAFDLLYCAAFVVMDKQWLETNATYMQFNVRKLMFICKKIVCFKGVIIHNCVSFLFLLLQDILKSTRVQLERELMIDDVLRIEDMPSYSLLL
jgi:hypothetical protein